MIDKSYNKWNYLKILGTDFAVEKVFDDYLLLRRITKQGHYYEAINAPYLEISKTLVEFLLTKNDINIIQEM